MFGGWIPYLGHALTFGKDYAALLEECAKKSNSNVFTIFIAGQRMTFVISPHDCSTVLRESKRLQFHPIGCQVMKDAFDCQLNPHAPAYVKWDEQSPKQWGMLRGASLTRLLSKTLPELSAAIDAYPELSTNQPEYKNNNNNNSNGSFTECTSLYTLVTNLIWTSTSNSLYGDLSRDGGKHLNDVRDSFIKYDSYFPLLLAGIPAKMLPGCQQASDHLRGLFTTPLSGKPSELLDFRHNFLLENMPTEAALSFQHAFVWAVFANTIPAAFWSLFWILRDPGCQEEVLKEVRSAFGSDASLDDEQRALKLAQHLHAQVHGGGAVDASVQEEVNVAVLNILEKLPLLDSIIFESLRLCIGSLTIRRAKEAFTLKLKDKTACKIRQADRVVIAPVMTHMDPEIYPDPKSFQRTRFLDPAAAKTKNIAPGEPHSKSSQAVRNSRVTNPRIVRMKSGVNVPASIALQPFGGGESMCPGRHFAVGEIKLFIALILLKWEIKLSGDKSETQESGQGSEDHVNLSSVGVPALDLTRAGLGILPPVPTDLVTCRFRARNKE